MLLLLLTGRGTSAICRVTQRVTWASFAHRVSKRRRHLVCDLLTKSARALSANTRRRPEACTSPHQRHRAPMSVALATRGQNRACYQWAGARQAANERRKEGAANGERQAASGRRRGRSSRRQCCTIERAQVNTATMRLLLNALVVLLSTSVVASASATSGGGSGGVARVPLRRVRANATRDGVRAAEALALSAHDDVYAGVVGLGSPTQQFNVVLDTSRTSLWIVDSSCASPQCRGFAESGYAKTAFEHS